MPSTSVDELPIAAQMDGYEARSVEWGDMTVAFETMGAADPAPLFEGDTIRVETEVAAKRESRSRPTVGIVEFVHRAFKQDGTLVAQCRRQAMMLRRPDESDVTIAT